MEDPTLLLPGLSPVSGKPIQGRFDGGMLSSDAGILVLREVEQRLGVAERFAGCIDDPDVPAALNDRAADNWRPLLAIADAAGGEWPVIARKASLALATEQNDDSIDVQLLRDIRAIFDERGVDRLASQDLVTALVALQDRPWSEWKGKPMTANALSRLLKKFSIYPNSIRIGPSTKDTPKGYMRVRFEDAWSRYAPLPAQRVVQSATTTHLNDSVTLGGN